jgi:hypothetical protein
MEDTMTADALKKITTDALDKLAALLDEGHSDQLIARVLPERARLSRVHARAAEAECRADLSSHARQS